MKLKEFDYLLPGELIAQAPAKPRDSSRLLVLGKKTGKIEHKHFYNIIDYLKAGDLLVMNDTKVFPARLIGNKVPHNGKIEVFLLRPYKALKAYRQDRATWLCLIGGGKAKEGLEIIFAEGLRGKAAKNNHDGTWLVEFNYDYPVMMKIVGKIGETPLPPYIKQKPKVKSQKSKADYQTVYAAKNKIGSVAAPTAGFHFTKRLMRKIGQKGVQIEYVTLHVGLGTFAPVKTENIKQHTMHPEWVEIKKETIRRILEGKREGRRVIAVGTTSVRALESMSQGLSSKNSEARSKMKKAKNQQSPFNDFNCWVDIFIYPGFKFRVVDAMLTNFHLPKSTLLMLVSAFAGRKNIAQAYSAAINGKYRFYSYGDSMFIA